MCFGPQQRALFRHGKVQKWSKHAAFTILNWKCMKCASRHSGVHFSTSQLLKVLRGWSVLCILTWTCASRNNGVQFIISHLDRWLRTRRFSEPNFRPSWATNHWKKHSESRLSYLFAHLNLLLLTLSLLWSSHFLASPLWLFPPLLFHLSILSEVWLLNFLRLWWYIESIPVQSV